MTEERNGLKARVDALESQVLRDGDRLLKRFDRLEKEVQEIKIELLVLIGRLGVLKYLGGLCLGGIATLIVRSFY